jgi:hypothetical protein
VLAAAEGGEVLGVLGLGEAGFVVLLGLAAFQGSRRTLIFCLELVRLPVAAVLPQLQYLRQPDAPLGG